MLATSGNAERRRAIDIVAELRAYREFIGPWLEGQEVAIELICPKVAFGSADKNPVSG